MTLEEARQTLQRAINKVEKNGYLVWTTDSEISVEASSSSPDPIDPRDHEEVRTY